MSHDESKIAAARRSIFEAAQDMLAGRLSYIEGARKICPARFAWGLDEWDPDLVPFVGIFSETDALPVGDERSLWQKSALEALAPEIARMEAWARKFGEPHSKSLVERFSCGEIEL
ncbi:MULTISPECIES: DUF2489 domain-containing protein [unclassified Bradyrhizobium]|uniref:DUF2489 domain-containing protein n=1 Tax=unclassified Bradyrhizobium TaxID=2631580 RepID=UPI0012EBDA1A|nr:MULTISPECIES: DUF2489 domain-containing protein [unclassified Bradyrhizobium]QIG96926.1 DUF2489 domain-containing protein [Bradyrhizobium sp. 6(2017)]